MEKLLYSSENNLVTLRGDLSQAMCDESFIVVIHCDKIPPHIGLLVNNLFFSLKSSGKDNGIDFCRLEVVLNKKLIPTLFFKLCARIDSNRVKKLFQLLPEYIPAGETCLNPVKDVLEVPQEIEHIGELLTYLKARNQIDRCFGVHLPENYKGIPFYTAEDIKKRIDYLQHAKRKEGIA